MNKYREGGEGSEVAVHRNLWTMVICYDSPISIKIGDNNSQTHSVENEIIIYTNNIIIIII